MSKGRVVKSKKAGLSDVGKQLANLKDEFGLAFDQIKNITLMATSEDKWKNDKGVLLYRKLLLATARNKDIQKKKEYIENFCRPWRKMYDAFKDLVLADDLSFLVDNDVVMTTGRNATLPISAMYNLWLEKDDDKLATLEAYMFHVFIHLVSEKEEEAEDRKTLQEICDQYEVEEDEAAKNAIGNIVKTVKGSMGNMEGKQPTVENIAPIVQAIIGNADMQNSMSSLAQNLLNGKTDIPSLVQSVRASVEADQRQNAEQEDGDEVPGLEEPDDEDSE